MTKNKRRARKAQHPGPGTQSRTWHHAYNGVPTVRASRTGTSRNPRAAFFDDAPPPPRDHIPPQSLSGRIRLELTVATPTVPGHQDPSGRIVVASLNGNNWGAQSWADATIPATSLKGVLSSAYEAVTESRLRVFREHDHVLTYRRSAREGQTLYPVLLTKKENGTWSARVMLGKNPRPTTAAHWDRPPSCVCAAALPDSEQSAVKIALSKKRYYLGNRKKGKQRGDKRAAIQTLIKLRAATPHLKHVSFTWEEENFYEGTRTVVSEVDGTTYAHSKSVIESGTDEGYVVRATPERSAMGKRNRGPVRLISTKYNEFVFFDSEENRTLLPVSDDVVSRLVSVIHSYACNVFELKRRESRAGGNPSSGTRRSTEPSTRLVEEFVRQRLSGVRAHDTEPPFTRQDVLDYLTALASQEPGVPLFAVIVGDDSGTAEHGGKVMVLGPSQVGRATPQNGVPPHRLAEDGDVLPAHDVAEASPADRLWGFVADEPDDDDIPSARGRIALTRAEPDTSTEKKHLRRAETGGWVPPILAGPKPETGAPYLRDHEGRHVGEHLTRGRLFEPGQTLIRKVYPTHRFLIHDYQSGKKKLPPPTRKAQSGEATQGSEVVVGSYLLPGAKLHATLRFTALTDTELAVLLWLLTPENLVPTSERNKGATGVFHIGLGKPLGWGAVEVRATDLVVADGKRLARGYADLSGCFGLSAADSPAERGAAAPTAAITSTAESTAPTPLAGYRDRLPELLPGFEASAAVRSFTRSAFGWRDAPDEDNVSYPVAKGSGSAGISATTLFFKKREDNRVKAAFPDARGRKDRPDSRFNLPTLDDDH